MLRIEKIFELQGYTNTNLKKKISCARFLHFVFRISKMIEVQQQFCKGEDCNKPAKLQCPTCLKAKISGSYFCSQDCFKKNWVIILKFIICKKTSEQKRQLSRKSSACHQLF